MGKTVAHTPKLKKKFFPFVSICTPTFNRRPFIPTMIECFKNYNYPKDRMEWIIVDDGTDPVEDILMKANIPQIKYIRSEKRMNLGEKRNYMHTFCKGTIIVYMDDDDYYPPDRVSHAVEVLTNNKDALCAGSSEIYIYFKHIKRMIQCGPYGPNHATAGTFAFKVELLKQTRYDDGAALAEEKNFLKEYTIPFAQLDPLKTILVFSHEHNTFDKRRLLENAHPDFLKESPKKVEDFIRFEHESKIKDFFMVKIDKLLEKYEAGEPKMKPDVLEQIKKIDEQRKQMTLEYEAQQRQRQQQNNNPKMMMNVEGQPPKEITQEELIHILNTYVSELQKLNQRNLELETQIKMGSPTPLPGSNDTSGFIKVLTDRISVLEKENILLNKKVNESNITNTLNTPNKEIEMKILLESSTKDNQKLKEENQHLIQENTILKNINKGASSSLPIPPSAHSSAHTLDKPPINMKLKSKTTPEVMVSIYSK